MTEFWHFLEQFEKWHKERKKLSRKGKGSGPDKFHPGNMDPTSWLRDSEHKGKT